MARAESQGIASRRLAVSNAFHSYLVQEAARQIGEKAPIPDKLGELNTCLFSNLVEGPVQPGLDLKPHFLSQIVSQVDFVHLVGQTHTECDFFIEVGPGRVLTNLVHAITGTTPCFPVASKPEADRDLNVLLAYAFTNGVDIHWPALYEGRLVRPFRSADQRVFIESPCERPLKGSNPLPASKTALPRPTDLLGGVLDCTESELQAYLTRRRDFLAEVIRADMRYLGETPWREQETKLTSSSAELSALHRKQQDAIGSILIDLISQKTGYPRESITLEMRLLDDLNLDSIKAAELITVAAKEIGMAGKLDASRFATARLEEVAAALRALQPGDSVKNAPDQEQPISPVILSIDPEHSDRTRYPSWVRDFAIELQEEPLLLSPEDRERVRAWWVARRCWIISEDAERDLAKQ